MKPVATVALAYGYYLGNPDGWGVKEANRFGALNLDWYHDIGADGSCAKFIRAATDHLTAYKAMDGVAFHLFGDLTPHSTEAYVLLAAQNSYTSTQNWGDSLSLTPEDLLYPVHPDWDNHLTAALSTLDLTPHQESAYWQIVPSLS